MDKLRAIKFFCRTVEMKSFTATARMLDVPISVLSKAISALEAELRFTLFNRSTRRLSLTEAGTNYYARCQQILVDIEEAETAAREGVVEATGILRVGIHPVFQISLCHRIHEFQTANPNVTVEIAHTNSPATLLDQSLDVLLRVGSIADSSFVAQSLGAMDLIVCASPAYLRTHGRPLHPRELGHHRAVIPGRADEDTFMRWSFSREAKSGEVTVPLSVVLREGVGLGIAAVGGAGIVRLYDVAARPFVEDGSLERILADWKFGRHPVYAVIPTRRNVPAKVRAFVKFAGSLVLA